jgi:hypothetical protein
MSLDGLRAWIGEVERKLGMRTRVFLVLSVIAIGGAGAAIYLAVDARDSAVSESDVQALQEQLEAQIGAGGAAGTSLAQLKGEVEALRAQVEESGGEGGGGSKPGGSEGNSGGASSGGSSGSESNANESVSEDSGGETTGESSSKAKLQEQLQQTKEQSEQAEKQEAEK